VDSKILEAKRKESAEAIKENLPYEIKLIDE